MLRICAIGVNLLLNDLSNLIGHLEGFAPNRNDIMISTFVCTNDTKIKRTDAWGFIDWKNYNILIKVIYIVMKLCIQYT